MACNEKNGLPTGSGTEVGRSPVYTTQQEASRYTTMAAQGQSRGYGSSSPCSGTTLPSYTAPICVVPSTKKSIVEAYILWFVFGLLGAHHFYLKRYGFGVLYVFTFGLLGLGWFVDLFRIPFLVKEANRNIPSPYPEPRKKNLSDAFVCWLPPFGLLGAHHFYLERYLVGALYTVTLGGFGIFWMIDVCRMKGLVDDVNEKLTCLSRPQYAPPPKKKSLCEAYILAAMPITGILGFHHYYLKRPAFGLLYTFTLGLLGVGYIFDLFRIPQLVNRANATGVNAPRYQKRYIDDAYCLWFPFGFLGLHHFYLHRPGFGVLYIFTFGLLGIGWLIDFCRIPYLVDECNKRLKGEGVHPWYLQTTITYYGQSNYPQVQPNPVHVTYSNETTATGDFVDISTHSAPQYGYSPPPYPVQGASPNPPPYSPTSTQDRFPHLSATGYQVPPPQPAPEEPNPNQNELGHLKT